MKKIIAIIALTAISTLTFAQTTQQQRLEKKITVQKNYTQNLIKAITNKNFLFTAQAYTPNFGAQMPVIGLNNYVDIHPAYVDVNLPYNSFSPNIPTPQALFFTTTTYVYQANIVNERAYVQITLNNAQNQGQTPDVPQNISFTINIEIVLTNGAATMTIHPNFNSPVTYNGNIALN